MRYGPFMNCSRTASMIFKTIFAFFLLFPSTGLPAGSPDEIRTLEKPVLDSFARGDFPALYESLERMLTERPDHPVSAMYFPDLVRMADVFGPARVLETVDAMILNLNRPGDFKSRGSALVQLSLIREDLLCAAGSEKKRSADREISAVRAWVLTGPIIKYGAGDLFYPFLPEKTMELASGEIPRKRIMIKNRKGALNLRDHLYPERGVAYATSSFAVNGRTRVRIYSDSLYKVFINGEEKASNTRDDFRRLRILEISGSEKISLTLKILAGETWGARVILTDENDAFVQPKIIDDAVFRTPCDVSEIEDYPCRYLQENPDMEPRTADIYLGNYFDEIGSRRALDYYARALAAEYDPATAYFYAAAMIRLSNHDRNSALHARGWRAMKKITASHPDFIPARAALLEMNQDESDSAESCREGERLIALCPKNYQAYDLYAALLSGLGLEAEFNRLVEQFTAAFPESPSPWLHRALFYAGKNLKNEKESLSAASDRQYIPEVMRALISACLSAGEPEKALALIKKHDEDEIFGKEAITAHIRRKDPSRARDALLREIVRRGDPDYYRILGRLNTMQRIDPSLYWLKALNLDPSDFGLSDYMEYLSTDDASHPLKKRLKQIDPWTSGSVLSAEDCGSPVSIISRERVIRIYHGGASRALCRDIVRINTEKGAHLWGEYRIPYRGRTIPVRVRVYSGPDEYTENYRIHSVDGAKYVSIGSLKQGSILEISYGVEDMFDMKQSGLMLEQAPVSVQDYDEPVLNYRLDLICPPDMDFSFMVHPDLIFGQGFDGENKVYTVSASSLPARHREQDSGHASNVLPYAGFTAMKNEEDLLYWYRGLMSGTALCCEEQSGIRISGADSEETVRRIHAFVTEEIRLAGNYLLTPEKAEDILFNKRGTAHDRAVLARALLEKHGITSYMALARNKYLPDPGGYISFQTCTHALVYVPLSPDKGLWLDFSSDYVPCGMVSGPLVGARALVLLSNIHEYRTISAASVNEKTCIISLAIDDRGNAVIDARLTLSGIYRSIDGSLKNSEYREETLYSYMRSFFPAIEIDDFSIDNIKNPGSPLIISVKGKANGLAVAGKGKLIIKPVLIPGGVYRYISGPERSSPLVIEYPDIENHEYRCILPEACGSSVVDENFRIVSKFGSAEFSIKKKDNSRELSVVKRIFIPSAKIKPQDYPEFLQFCLDLKKIEYYNVTIDFN